MSSQRPTNAVVVAGMHRSGTSLVTRLCSLWGLELPQDDIGARRGNERGHWESLAVIELNEWLLREAKASWFDMVIPDPMPVSDAVAQRFSDTLATAFGPADNILVKDPRITKLTGTWVDALAELGVEQSYLLVVRNPLEVAESLLVRDSIPREQGALLWLLSVLNTELATREQSRAIVDFGDVLADWFGALNPIATRLFPDTEHVVVDRTLGEQTVDPGLRHHVVDDQLTAELGDWVDRAYRALRELTVDDGSIAACKDLDELRREVAAAGPLLRSSLPTVEGELRHELAGLRGQLRDDAVALEKSVADTERADAKVAELEAQILEHRRAERSWETTRLMLEDRSARLEAVESSRSWRLAWTLLAPYRRLRMLRSR